MPEQGDAFDAYSAWLHIPPGRRPPDHYALLGLPALSGSREEIEQAAHEQLAKLDRYALHPDAEKRAVCQRLMNGVAQARGVLCDPAKRRAYDVQFWRSPDGSDGSQQSRSAPRRQVASGSWMVSRFAAGVAGAVALGVLIVIIFNVTRPRNGAIGSSHTAEKEKPGPAIAVGTVTTPATVASLRSPEVVPAVPLAASAPAAQPVPTVAASAQSQPGGAPLYSEIPKPTTQVAARDNGSAGDRLPPVTRPAAPRTVFPSRIPSAAERSLFRRTANVALAANDMLWPNRVFAVGDTVCIATSEKLRLFSLSKKSWLTASTGIRDAFVDDQGLLGVVQSDFTLAIAPVTATGVGTVKQQRWPAGVPQAECSSLWTDGLQYGAMVCPRPNNGVKGAMDLYVLDLSQSKIISDIDVSAMGSNSFEPLLIKDARYVAYGNWNVAEVYDAHSGQVYMTLPPETKPNASATPNFPRRFAASADGAMLVSHAGDWADGSGAHFLTCFDLVGRKKLWGIDLSKDALGAFHGAQFSADGRSILVGLGSAIVQLQASDGAEMGRIPIENKHLLGFRQMKDGQVYALSTAAASYTPGAPPPECFLSVFQAQPGNGHNLANSNAPPAGTPRASPTPAPAGGK